MWYFDKYLFCKSNKLYLHTVFLVHALFLCFRFWFLLHAILLICESFFSGTCWGLRPLSPLEKEPYFKNKYHNSEQDRMKYKRHQKTQPGNEAAAEINKMKKEKKEKKAKTKPHCPVWNSLTLECWARPPRRSNRKSHCKSRHSTPASWPATQITFNHHSKRRSASKKRLNRPEKNQNKNITRTLFVWYFSIKSCNSFTSSFRSSLSSSTWTCNKAHNVYLFIQNSCAIKISKEK